MGNIIKDKGQIIENDYCPLQTHAHHRSVVAILAAAPKMITRGQQCFNDDSGQ